MQNKITVQLTNEKFKEIYTDEKFRNQVSSAHWQCKSNGEKVHQITCSYPVTYIVTPEQIETAKVERARAKQAKLDDVGNKLVFVGMGWTYEPRYEDDVCNHRIRTELVNADGREFFVEVGTGRGENMRVDFAIDRTRQKELDDSFERQGEFYNYKNLERGNYGFSVKYTLQNVLKFVNENFGCNFREIEIDNYNLSAEDYKSVSPSFPYLVG